MLYLHIYRTESGQWAGKILEEVAGLAGFDNPLDMAEAALEEFPDIQDLPKDPAD